MPRLKSSASDHVSGTLLIFQADVLQELQAGLGLPGLGVAANAYDADMMSGGGVCK